MDVFCKSQEEKTPPSRKTLKSVRFSRAAVLFIICLEIVALYLVRFLFSSAAFLGPLVAIVSVCAFSFISILMLKNRRK